MPMLTINEYQYATITNDIRQQIQTMMLELAYDSGCNWQDEYRWALMTPENYFLAQLKYAQLLEQFKVQ